VFPKLSIGDCRINFVTAFKYLGHIITENSYAICRMMPVPMTLKDLQCFSKCLVLFISKRRRCCLVHSRIQMRYLSKYDIDVSWGALCKQAACTWLTSTSLDIQQAMCLYNDGVVQAVTVTFTYFIIFIIYLRVPCKTPQLTLTLIISLKLAKFCFTYAEVLHCPMGVRYSYQT